MVVAMHFNAFFRHARTVTMANLAQIVNVIAPIVTRPDGLLLQTTFFPFEVIRRVAGDVALDVHWSGDTFSSVAADATRTLDVSATLDERGKRLAVFVVNRSKDAELDAAIVLDAGRFAGPVTAQIINGRSVDAVNTFDDPGAVGVRESALEASGTRFDIGFEPHSVTALSFDLA